MLKAVERLRMLSIIHTEYGVRVSRDRRSTRQSIWNVIIINYSLEVSQSAAEYSISIGLPQHQVPSQYRVSGSKIPAE